MTGRIAVTGSSGHLGRAVVEDLLAHGYVALEIAPHFLDSSFGHGLGGDADFSDETA